jgi:hypothetical protein
LGFDIDIQEDGPLLEGKKVTLAEATRVTPYRLAIPPTNELTGRLSGIWIDSTDQVAFVSDTDLRMYQSEPDRDLVEAAMADVWAQKVQTEVGTPWRLVDIDGHVALALDGGTDANGRKTYSLTYMDEGLSLQFVSTRHSVTTLVEFAESVTYERAGESSG